MAKIYVDSNNIGGTYDGLSMATAYQDFSLAIAGSLLSGDNLYCASDHNKDYGVETTLTFPSDVTIYSVNSTTLVYQKGFIEHTTSGSFTVTMPGLSSVHGGHLRSSDITQTEIRVIYDSIIEAASGTGRWYPKSSYCLFSKSSLILNGSSVIVYYSGHTLDIIASTITTNTISYDGLFLCSGNNTRTIIKNCDLTGVTPNSKSIWSTYNSDNNTMTITNSKVPVGISFYDVVNPKAQRVVAAVNGCIGAHQFDHYDEANGASESDDVTFLDATYDGTNGFSVHMGSNSNSSIDNPLKHTLAILPVQDITVNKTYTINFQSNTQLSDSDFWMTLERPNGTDLDLVVTQSSRSLLQAVAGDILDSNAKYTDDNNAGWSGTQQTYQYSTSLTVIADAAFTNINVSIYAYLVLPITDVNVCPLVVVT